MGLVLVLSILDRRGLKQGEFLVTKRVGRASIKIGSTVRVEIDRQALQL